MRRARLLFFAPLVIACCNDDTTSNPVGESFGYQSGSRLRARARVAEGGSRVLAAWRDTKLGADCSFALAEDGATRCMPSGATVVFTDQLCTQAVAVYDTSCGSPPAYATTSLPSDGCDSAVRVYRVGDAVDVGRHLYFGAGGAGGCVRAAQLDPSLSTFAVEAIDPGTFVSAKIARTAMTSRLGVEGYLAEDGSLQVRSLYDVSRDRCFSIAGAIGGGEDRCVPDAVAWATYAGDAACKTPVAYQITPSRGCPPAGVVVSYKSEGCATTASYFAPGPTKSIDDVFVRTSDAACVKLRTQPDLYSQVELDHVFYAVGDPVAADTFPALVTKPAGRGRLAVQMLTSDDGTALAVARPDRFFDTLLGPTCQVQLWTDGTRRCVPVEAVPITTRSFTDAACTHEIVGVPRSPSCTTEPLPGYAVRVTADTCSPDVKASALLRLGNARSLDIFYVTDDAGTCSSQPSSGGTFVDVVEEVDPATLARISEIVE